MDGILVSQSLIKILTKTSYKNGLYIDWFCIMVAETCKFRAARKQMCRMDEK